MKRLACLPVLVLAACPPPATGPQQPMSSAGVGCPAPANVFVASYMTPEEPPTPEEAAREAAAHPGTAPLTATRSAPSGHTGWVLPLHDRKLDQLGDAPAFVELDAAAAAAAGVPVAPPTVWLVTPGQPPCRATAGAYYAAAFDGSVSHAAFTPNITYGVELAGCGAPPKDQQQDAEAFALISDQPPTECQILAPQPVAARLGDVDAQGHWQRPTKATAMPPAFAGAVPAHDCQAPGCEALWAVAQVDVANQPVAWTGAVNWLTIPANASLATTPPADACRWKAETFAGFFVAGPDGRAVKVTEGQDQPLLLTAVLADRAGPRALVAEGTGEYTVYALAAGTVSVARHLVWLLFDTGPLDERLGPSCDGNEPEPAPAPGTPPGAAQPHGPPPPRR